VKDEYQARHRRRNQVDSFLNIDLFMVAEEALFLLLCPWLVPRPVAVPRRAAVLAGRSASKADASVCACVLFICVCLVCACTTRASVPPRKGEQQQQQQQQRQWGKTSGRRAGREGGQEEAQQTRRAPPSPVARVPVGRITLSPHLNLTACFEADCSLIPCVLL
jgi:hypothetical protein